MPEIEIRPVIASDINALQTIDHHYTSDHVWQLDLQHEREDNHILVNLRQVRLPRSVKVEYPRSPRSLSTNWTKRSGLLVATLDQAPIGYASLMLDMAPSTTWITDFVVKPQLRRQGIGSALILAAMEWALHMDCQNLILEMHPKNHPAIQMAFKLGFEFCGYNDRYYQKHGVGIFFGKVIR